MKKKLIVVAMAAIFAGIYLALGLDRYLSVSELKALAEREFVWAASIYVISFLFIGTFNLPGSGPLTVGSGIVFGLWWGILLSSFASTIAATLSMISARTLFHEWAEKRFSKLLTKINRGLAEDGTLYLIILRLIPGLPYFIVNPVFGLTRISAFKFFVVSKIGMFPVVVIYVNAGAELGSLEGFSFYSILNPQIIISFALLLLFPVLAKSAVKAIRSRKHRDDFDEVYEDES